MSPKHCFNRKFGLSEKENHGFEEISYLSEISVHRLLHAYRRAYKHACANNLECYESYAWSEVYRYALTH